jgi:prepilin-type N-terminal cleavage/methylation domain-containing protein
MKKRLGMTLIELVVVVAIVGVLAAMLLPKLEGLQSAVNHVAAGSSMADAVKLISAYKVAKNVYPDNWDSLTDGTTLWTAGNAGTPLKGLHPQLVDASNGKLTLGTALTTTQITALQNAGITTVLNVSSAAASTTSSTRAGDVFLSATTISASTPIAVINKSTTAGKKIIDRIYRYNQVSGNSGAINSSKLSPTGDTTTQLVVFGLGPQNALIPNSMAEAPTYGNVNATYVYNRLLAVFEVTATAVTFKTMLGCDGDLLDDLTINMQNSKL